MVLISREAACWAIAGIEEDEDERIDAEEAVNAICGLPEITALTEEDIAPLEETVRQLREINAELSIDLTNNSRYREAIDQAEYFKEKSYEAQGKIEALEDTIRMLAYIDARKLYKLIEQELSEE